MISLNTDIKQSKYSVHVPIIVLECLLIPVFATHICKISWISDMRQKMLRHDA